MKFKIDSEYRPSGDQPAAIKGICDALDSGVDAVTLLGVTGSGKTFTMANVIEKLQRPALILSHNKTLAAQLYGELWCTSSVSISITASEPFPKLRADMTESLIRFSSFCEGLRRSTTSSMKWALYRSREVISLSSSNSPSTLTWVYPLLRICSRSSL